MLVEKLAKDTAYLFSSSIFGRILGAVTGLVTARILGPADYGLLKIINYVPSLAKYGSIGLSAVANREIPHMRGQKLGIMQENEVKNISFTIDLVWGMILSFLVILVSLFYDNQIVRYGLWITAATLFIGTVKRLYYVILNTDKRFKHIATLEILGSIVSFVVILTTIYWGRIFSVLSAGLITAIITLAVMMKYSNLDFEFNVKKKELFRQLKIGIPMAGGTFAFGLFGWTQRGVIIGLFGSEVLGYYMLFLFIIEGTFLFMNNFLRSIAIDLYENLGRDGIDSKTKDMVIKPTLLMALVFPIVGGLIWIISPIAINIIVPQYSPVLPAIFLIVPILTFESTSSLVRTAMNSAHLNMQVHVLILWLVTSLFFTVGVNIFAEQNSPIMVIAISRVLASLVLFVGGFFLTRKYFFNTIKDFIKNIIKTLFPLIVVFTAILSLNHFIWQHSFVHILLKLLIFMCLMIPLFWQYNRILNLTSIIKKIISK